MYRKILAAVDFSEPSREAVRWAADAFPGAGFVLCHVVESAEAPAYLREVLEDHVDLRRERRLDAESNLEHLAGELDAPAEVRVTEGWPPEQIARIAERVGADLVLVGAHTRRVHLRDRPGATVEAVAMASDVPVLTWRPGPSDAERTVVGLLDLRDGSEPVAAVAGRLARHLGARLIYQHVMGASVMPGLRAVTSQPKALEARRKLEAAARQQMLRWIPAELRDRPDVHTVVSRGHPVTQILALAERESADLLVLGRAHLPGGAAVRSLLGDVTARVARGASCSVLTLPL